MRLLQYCHRKDRAQTGLNDLLQAQDCDTGLGRDGAAVGILALPNHFPVY